MSRVRPDDRSTPDGGARSFVADLVYDVGLHDGADSAYYLRNGFRVVAVEANPLFAERARRRFAREIAAGRFTVINVGIAAGNGRGTFWVCDDHSDWSSFDRSIASRRGARHHAIEVPLRSFRDILEEHGLPRYCKIDIEGNDHLCLEALDRAFRPPFVSVELTPRELTPRPLIERLCDLGFDRFKIVHQLSFSAPSTDWYRVRRRARLRLLQSLLEQGHGLIRGHRIDRGWYFRVGSSGPLPERTAGRWLPSEQATALLHTLDELFARGWLGQPDWFDVHATDRDALAQRM